MPAAIHVSPGPVGGLLTSVKVGTLSRVSAIVLLIALVSRPLLAQRPDYVPTYQLPEGRQFLVVYIGASTCGPCLLPNVETAVRSMKTLIAAQATQMHASFSVIGVANDWEVTKAAAFLDSLGTFDQVVLGGNWTNLATERFVWRDPQGTPAMPQILVFERTVTLGDRITFSEPRMLRRLTGAEQIPAWVAAGAPISAPDTTHH